MVTAPALQVALTETIVQQGRLSVRIDLAQVTFMDSSGLRVLMVSFNELQERGGRLEITNPSPITMKLFEATGLTKVFTISFPAPSGPAEDGQTPTA